MASEHCIHSYEPPPLDRVYLMYNRLSRGGEAAPPRVPPLATGATARAPRVPGSRTPSVCAPLALPDRLPPPRPTFFPSRGPLGAPGAAAASACGRCSRCKAGRVSLASAAAARHHGGGDAPRVAAKFALFYSHRRVVCGRPAHRDRRLRAAWRGRGARRQAQAPARCSGRLRRQGAQRVRDWLPQAQASEAQGGHEAARGRREKGDSGAKARGS